MKRSWIALALLAWALWLAPASVKTAWATCPAAFTSTSIASDANCIFRDYVVDGVPSSGPNDPYKPDIRTLLGVVAGNFSGSGAYGVSQNGIGTPTGGTSGYAAGDTLTLACTGVTFVTAPVIGIAAVSGGGVTQAIVSYPGFANGPVPSSPVACTQASTTGSGTGYAVLVALAPMAAYVSPAPLGQGGSVAANGNLFLNMGDLPAKFNAGAENFFAGDKAGFGLFGTSSFGVALGHNACGNGGAAGGVIANFMLCIGNDAGRNLAGSASNGSDVLIGFGTGRNMANGYNVMVGGSVADSNGTNNSGYLTGLNNALFGYGVARNLRAGGANSLFGANAGSQLVDGSGNIIIEASGSGDNCANGDELNVLRMCSGIGPVFTILAGGGTPTTSLASVAGLFQIKGLPTSAGGGGLYVCADSNGNTYKKSSCP